MTKVPPRSPLAETSERFSCIPPAAFLFDDFGVCGIKFAHGIHWDSVTIYISQLDPGFRALLEHRALG